jgi:hypothetical protein
MVAGQGDVDIGSTPAGRWIDGMGTTMERKDAFMMLLLLGGGGYAVYANWTAISTKLGLDDFYPGRIKAIQLAKEANSFEQYRSNWTAVQARMKNGEIKGLADPWNATEIAAPKYRVTCTFFEEGERRVHVFLVDVGTRAVQYQGLDESRPAPR